MTKFVKDIMNTDGIAVKANESLQDASAKMTQNNIVHLL